MRLTFDGVVQGACIAGSQPAGKDGVDGEIRITFRDPDSGLWVSAKLLGKVDRCQGNLDLLRAQQERSAIHVEVVLTNEWIAP